jgi:hypothetical protein
MLITCQSSVVYTLVLADRLRASLLHLQARVPGGWAIQIDAAQFSALLFPLESTLFSRFVVASLERHPSFRG